MATAHSRLNSISPRHYADFVDFLAKAKETFLLSARDGHDRFRRLVDGVKAAYKGKKKLVAIINARFRSGMGEGEEEDAVRA